MAKRLAIINKMRPKLKPQGIVDFERMSQRMAKNTTFNENEMFGILRIFVSEALTALENGEIVKLDGLVNISPNIGIGGRVNMSARWNRGAAARLNRSQLWTADKVHQHANLNKSTAELIAAWNQLYPDDPLEDE